MTPPPATSADPSVPSPARRSAANPLPDHILAEVRAAGGWLGFDAFMALALYTPGLGYYANDTAKFGPLPYVVRNGERQAGSDFVTAPEMTPLFGRTLARQVAQALEATGTTEVWEFGAGSGALAEQLLQALGDKLRRYTIVDLSGSLRERQQQRLQAFAGKVAWAAALPDRFEGVVVGNEVLDAMPVKLLARVGGAWHERGVVASTASDGHRFAWQDRPTDLRPPVAIAGEHDYLTEIHPQGEGFMRMLAQRLAGGAAFLIDYGFPEGEYYHPQRHMGTVMCHQGHRADGDPLADVGLKDITAHVNFTGIALAAQDAGLHVLGYAPQARFLMNSGLLQLLDGADLRERVLAQKLLMEHEMGELFKVIAVGAGEPWQPMGFAQGDRTHTL